MIDRMLINSLFQKRLRLLDNKKKLYQISKSVDEIFNIKLIISITYGVKLLLKYLFINFGKRNMIYPFQ